MLLKEIVERNRCAFFDRAVDWEEAIGLGCLPLVADGTVGENYAREIVECVKKHGPYIVVMPGFALPHLMENSPSAYGTAIGLMKLEHPVSFDDSDPDKSASVFFSLAATDSDLHLKNMRRLFTMLTNEDLCSDLLGARSVEDLLAIDAKYEK